MFYKFLMGLFAFNLLILSFVSGVIFHERVVDTDVQLFDIGEKVLISRGYYKGCKAQIISFDGKNEEYTARVKGCVTRKHKPTTAEVFSTHELMHIISSLPQSFIDDNS